MYNRYNGRKTWFENQSLDHAIKAKQGGCINLLDEAYYIVAYCASGAIVSISPFTACSCTFLGTMCRDVAVVMNQGAINTTVGCGCGWPTRRANPDRRCPGRCWNRVERLPWSTQFNQTKSHQHAFGYYFTPYQPRSSLLFKEGPSKINPTPLTHHARTSSLLERPFVRAGTPQNINHRHFFR
jgi:hypothetical protein